MDSNHANNYDSKEEIINVVCAVCVIVGAITSVAATVYYSNYIDKGPRENTYITNHKFIKRVVSSDEHCYNLLRMNVICFDQFVDEFRRREAWKTPSTVQLRNKLQFFSTY